MVGIEQLERWRRTKQLQRLCGNSLIRTTEVRYHFHLDDFACEQFRPARNDTELYGRARDTVGNKVRIYDFGYCPKDRGGENRPGLRTRSRHAGNWNSRGHFLPVTLTVCSEPSVGGLRRLRRLRSI